MANSRITLIVLCIGLFTASSHAYSGGAGTAEDPYQIATAEDLIALGNTPDDYYKHFTLTADIDLAGYTFDRAVIAPDTDPSTPNRQGPAFTGVFAGEGHVISNLHIEGQSHLGLFGCIGWKAEVHDLELDNSLVEGTGEYIGGLAGCNGGYCRGCRNSGTISGHDNVGGLVGYCSVGTVSNCRNDGQVLGRGDRVGGLVGNVEGTGAILNCSSTGTVIGDACVGGLVGRNLYHVTECCSAATVTGNEDVGGLIGLHSGILSESCSTGVVTGSARVGGLLGSNYWSCRYCYSTASVTGDDAVGGLIGSEAGGIMHCYSAGLVTGTTNVGGLIGTNTYDASNGFWNVETSGQTASDGGTPLTDAEMRHVQVYLDAGWDFLGETKNGSEDIWWMDTDGPYPVLPFAGCASDSLAGYSGGSGTPEDPYRIATPLDLIALGSRLDHYDKYFIQTADIDLSGHLFDGAVIAPDPYPSWEFEGTPFAGVFDGGDHVISGLHIEGQEFLGLFGYVAEGARVTNVVMEDCLISGQQDYAGGIVGCNKGAVTYCRCAGVVTTNEWCAGGVAGANDDGVVSHCCSAVTVTSSVGAGGIVGGNDGGCVLNCTTAGTVAGDYYAGGVAGYSDSGCISNCYNVGIVKGHECIGGLVGESYGTIANCYSAGPVLGQHSAGGLGGSCYGRVVHSFWDLESSGIASSSGGVGLTTAEMMDPQWIGLQGWGGDPNWVLDSYEDYPRLAWEGTAGQPIPEPVVDWITGQGTSDMPFEISSVSQLLSIGKASLLWEKHLVLVDDLDLAGHVWPNSVIPDFTVTFDGRGHLIENLTISASGYTGFFGHLAQGATVCNLGLLNAEVTGGAYGVGALIGRNFGSARNCYSDGIVRGDYMTGGLVGYNSGHVSDAYSTAEVAGSWFAGGLIGENPGVVTNCYSAGPVQDGAMCGGLVGDNSGSVTHSFWDEQSSGHVQSDGGAGLSTVEMMDPYWIGLQGWGQNPSWVLESYQDYPRLAWEGTSGQTIPEPMIDWMAGQGTDQSPYEINSASQLVAVGRASLLWDRTFILTANVDLTGLILSDAVIPDFTGKLDGNGYAITNLTISAERNLGLVGHLREGGRLLNLGLTDVDIAGTGKYVAALVARNHQGDVSGCYSTGRVFGSRNVGGLMGANESGTVADCHSECVVDGEADLGGLVGCNQLDGIIIDSYGAGNVYGQSTIGGLVGHNDSGVIDGCYAMVSARGEYAVGGMVGKNSTGTISDCNSAGTVVGNSSVGGLIGHNWDSTVSNCHSDCNIDANDYYAGGLVGYSYASDLWQCSSTGIVVGNSHVGGIVGHNGFEGSILRCYSTATVMGHQYVGGLVGHSDATVRDCYCTGDVSGDRYVGGLVGENGTTQEVLNCFSVGVAEGNEDVGGLVGASFWNSGIEASFWDVQASGQATSAGGEGLLTSQMMRRNTYLTSGWDFAGEMNNGSEGIWWIDEGRSYPHLSWEFGGGR